jgi:hypothetical protein
MRAALEAAFGLGPAAQNKIPRRTKMAATYEALLRGDDVPGLQQSPAAALLGDEWKPSRAWDELLLLKARAAPLAQRLQLRSHIWLLGGCCVLSHLLRDDGARSAPAQRAARADAVVLHVRAPRAPRRPFAPPRTRAFLRAGRGSVGETAFGVLTPSGVPFTSLAATAVFTTDSPPCGAQLRALS